jgi:hypothetical protein
VRQMGDLFTTRTALKPRQSGSVKGINRDSRPGRTPASIALSNGAATVPLPNLYCGRPLHYAR